MTLTTEESTDEMNRPGRRKTRSSSRMMRPAVGALVILGVLAGLSGVTPPAARAEPDDEFAATAVAEVRLSNAEFESALNLLLAGTRIQISHTGNGTTVEGAPHTYTVEWKMPLRKFDEICENPDPNRPPPGWCEDGPPTSRETFRTYTPQLSSYIDFGPPAEMAGAPDNLPLPIEAVEKGLSTVARAAILALQGPVVALDIDRIRLLANNLNVDLSDGTRRFWSIGGGGINLSVKLQSSDPSIKCEGHFKAKVGYVVTVSEGWADELCPDFNLSRMDLAVKLIPTAADGLLTVGDAQVTAQLESQGVVEALADVFKNTTNEAAVKIQTKIRARLLEEQTKKDLGEVLTAAATRIALQRGKPDVCRVVSAQVVGSDLVIRYLGPLPPFTGCSGLHSGDGGPVAPVGPGVSRP